MWIWKCWFLRRENRSTRRETSRSKGENQQQTQPTYDVKPGYEPGPHWWGGGGGGGGCKWSHHCATRALHGVFRNVYQDKATNKQSGCEFSRVKDALTRQTARERNLSVTSTVVLGQMIQTVFWLGFYDVLSHSNKIILSLRTKRCYQIRAHLHLQLCVPASVRECSHR